MVDEFGYTFSNRFIFNSNWDDDFYTISKPEQVKLSKKVTIHAVAQQTNNPANTS